ncbi:MAG: acetylglutamate kinase [Idiomarina sp.]|nr:acetylglutamate kinase [Idiomarina sp.]
MKDSANTPLVIKIGGRALENVSRLDNLFQRIASLATQRPCVLVHGGGNQIDQWLQQFNRPLEKQHGLRITPAQDMPVVAGVLAGALNVQLVATFNHAVGHIQNAPKAMAVGVSLADAGWCTLAHDSPRGAVGAPIIKDSSASYLLHLLAGGLIPVVCSIGSLSDGTLANVNADLAAAAVAGVLGAELLLLTDVDAILNKNGEIIENISAVDALALIADGTVIGGMRIKLEAAVQAAQLSRRSTAVAAWYSQAALTALLNGQATATRIFA